MDKKVERSKPQEKEIIIKIDKIPEGSQLDKYLKDFEIVFSQIKNDNGIDCFEKFLKDAYHDCLKLLMPSNPRFAIKLLLVYNDEQYLKFEQEADKRNIKKEVAKGPSTSFVIDNGITATIYVNVYRLLSYGDKASFIINLVEAYMHEILHISYPNKTEQEIHDLVALYLGKFLGIELPEAYRKLNASDYYIKKT